MEILSGDNDLNTTVYENGYIFSYSFVLFHFFFMIHKY